MKLSRKIIILIEWCENHGQYENLVAAVKKERKAGFDAAFGAGVSPTGPIFYRPAPRSPKQIFLSHSSQDEALALRLMQELRAKGWQVWKAPESIQPGEKVGAGH